MVSSEYTNRTLKQNLIDGLSKKEFILSKFYGVLGFALASTLLLFIVSLVLGLIFSDYNEVGIIFSDLEYIFAYFLKLIGFFSMCLFFGILLRRSAFALGFLFLLWIFEGIVQLFVKFQAESLEFIINFLPLQSMGNLIIEPFSRLGIIKSAATQLNSEFEKSYDVEWSAILIVMAWSFIFIFSSWKLLQKRDL
jgi:ABC-type transport system involved in multi-copper enzyme maturation permease subunit